LVILAKARAFLSTTTQSSCFKQPGVYPGLLQKRVLYDVTAGGWGGASLCSKHRNSKIAAVHATAWRFGTEGLIKMNFCIKADEKSTDTAFYHL
jgi:hypothetical protein